MKEFIFWGQKKWNNQEVGLPAGILRENCNQGHLENAEDHVICKAMIDSDYEPLSQMVRLSLPPAAELGQYQKKSLRLSVALAEMGSWPDHES